jgi:hypothetical protein
MDAIYFRDKAEACLRLAKGLSWNNPARGELMELAEEFQRQAEELEATKRRPHADRDFRAQAADRVPGRMIYVRIFPVFTKD